MQSLVSDKTGNVQNEIFSILGKHDIPDCPENEEENKH